MSISTLSFNTTTRVSLMRLQGEVGELAQQLNNGGRLNDVGRTLGRLTGSAISARSLGESMKEQQTSNGILDRRLKNVDAAMATMSEGVEALANNLIGVSVGKDWAGIVQQANSGLAQMTGSLNAADGGSYIFGGIQTDRKPIDLDKSAAARAQAATHFNAFVAAATASQTVPVGQTAAKLVTAEQMKQYLTDGFTDPAIVVTPAVAQVYKYSDLFALTPNPIPNTSSAATFTNWETNWSDASSVKGESRISATETVVTVASANDKTFRDMASAYSMLSDLGIGDLGEAARSVVLETASKTLKAANAGITAARAEIGTTLKRIESANTELLRQQDIMENTVNALEEEDITEIGVRVNNLKTNLDAAYAVTASIQKLSLLNYL